MGLNGGLAALIDRVRAAMRFALVAAFAFLAAALVLLVIFDVIAALR